jgi:hypothetical protein
MSQRIIYQTDDGGVAIIIPSAEALEQHGIQSIAIKDVPGSGTPYWIVDASEIPSDRSERNAWTIDTSVPPTGVTP